MLLQLLDERRSNRRRWSRSLEERQGKREELDRWRSCFVVVENEDSSSKHRRSSSFSFFCCCPVARRPAMSSTSLARDALSALVSDLQSCDEDQEQPQR